MDGTGLRWILCWLALLSTWPRLLAAEPPSDADTGPEQEMTLPPPRPLPAIQAPAGGLPLDEAIDLLLQRSYDLRVKAQDIPKARADVLSAGLRNNPSIFYSADGIPYDRYSQARPGETDYEITLIQPTDVNGKRQRRIKLAERSLHVIEALFQDAVRQEVDRLYTTYLNVWEALLEVQAAEADLALQQETVKTIRVLVEQQQRPRTALIQVEVEQSRAEIARGKAQAGLQQAQRDLALLLAAPIEQADALLPSGPLRDSSPLPCVDDLVELALKVRPDLHAYRLNVARAQAQVQRSRAERFDDVFFFYTPYMTQTFPGQPVQAAPGWEVGTLAVLPVFDRKQGDITRASIEVSQTRMEVEGMQQQVIQEVRQAVLDCTVARQSVERYERDILPASRRVIEEKQRLVTSGTAAPDVVLAARKDYNDAARKYAQALLLHRRAMLRLNTVVGQRIQP
jgi:cobalt-zinc-cadmium efflux system outer membrane protein